MRSQNEVKDEVLARAGRYRVVHPPRVKSDDPSPLKVKQVWVGERRYVVSLKQDEVRKDAADREAIVAALWEPLRSGDKSLVGNKGRATASKIPVILAVLDGNLVCSYNVYYWHVFHNHPNYGCTSLEYSQNFRSITVSGLPYLMKNPHFDAVALATRVTAVTSAAVPPYFRSDEAKVAEDARSDGKRVLRANTELNAAEVALQYKQLGMVEPWFRSCKALLQTRPISHQCIVSSIELNRSTQH
jgi:hypothetical protein